jgi:hypothetical protein
VIDFVIIPSVFVSNIDYVLGIVDSATEYFIDSCGIQGPDNNCAAEEVPFVFRHDR